MLFVFLLFDLLCIVRIGRDKGKIVASARLALARLLGQPAGDQGFNYWQMGSTRWACPGYGFNGLRINIKFCFVVCI